MIKIKKRQSESEEILPELEIRPETTIDNELEHLRYLGHVKSRINKEVTEDFTYASLDDKDKEAVIEMTTDAYTIKRMFEIAEKKATKWTFDNDEQVWELRPMDKNERELINKYGVASFETVMTRVIMTVIMNRNKPKNPLIRLLAKANKEEESNDEQQISIINDALKKINKKEKSNKTSNEEEEE
jgi:hypothetical protein